MKRLIHAIVALTVLSSLAAAQCVHRNDVILNKQNKPIGGAKIYVCQQPASGIPCANPVTLYTDLTCTTVKPQPVITDANGNFDIYSESQWVTLQAIWGYVAPITYTDYGLFVVGGSTVGRDFSFDIPAPTLSDSGIYDHKIDSNQGVLRISCSTDVGTANIDLQVRSESTPNNPGTLVIGPTGLACNSSTGIATLFTSSSVPQNSVIVPILNSVSGSPGILRIHVSTAAK